MMSNMLPMSQLNGSHQGRNSSPNMRSLSPSFMNNGMLNMAGQSTTQSCFSTPSGQANSDLSSFLNGTAASAPSQYMGLSGTNDMVAFQQLMQHQADSTANSVFQSLLQKQQQGHQADSTASSVLQSLLQKQQQGQAQSAAQLGLFGPTSGNMFGVSNDSNALKPASMLLKNHQLLMPRAPFDTTATTRLLASRTPASAAFGLPSVSAGSLPSPSALFRRDGAEQRKRGGVIEPFPEKLHRLLLEVEAAGRADVISFVAGGRAFSIHKPDVFFKEIVPLYFRQSRLSSFKRQLNLYGFELITTGPARGGYYHESFSRDKPELCRKMRRVLGGTKAATAAAAASKDDSDGDSITKNEGRESTTSR